MNSPFTQRWRITLALAPHRHWMKVMVALAAVKPNSLARWTEWNIVFLALLWGAENMVGERRWLTALLLYAPQQGFGLPTGLLLLTAARGKQWKIVGANLGALIVFGFVFLSVNVPLALSHAPGDENLSSRPLRVLTYNIEHGAAGAARIAAVVRRAQPDIVCLQEADAGEGQGDPTPQLQHLLPEWHMARYGELVTFSRFSIASQQKHRLLTRIGSGILETILDVRGQRLAVLDVHFNIPIDGLAGMAPSTMHATSIVRDHQLSALMTATKRLNSPCLILGDFNTPPRGWLYKSLTSRFTDAFRACGWGTGNTWFAGLPVTRIDYIFTMRQTRIIHCHALNERDSDHRPVYGEVVLDEP